jgi:hypothetical protein
LLGIFELHIRQQIAAFLDLEADIHAGFTFGQEIAPPTGEHIGPGLDHVNIPAGPVRGEARLPAVVLLQGHGDAEPFLGSVSPPQQVGREHGMSIAKDIGPDLDLLAEGPLNGKTASIDDGIHVFDVDAMSGEVADGADAGIRCHGSIVFFLPGRWKPH